MSDIISKYKKHNIIKNTWLVTMSLILALGINFVVQDTSMWQKLQISVLNSTENSKVWDIFLKKSEDGINIIAWKDMNQVKSLSLSVSFNPTNVKINSIISSIWGNILTQANEEWLNTLIINFSLPVDIKSWSELISINANKIEEKLENLNIINANFTDSSNQVFLLSSSGVEF